MKIFHTYHFSLSLIAGALMISCSSNNSYHSSSKPQQDAPNIHTDFIAESGKSVEQIATVDEILVQFHGCKAHQ